MSVSVENFLGHYIPFQNIRKTTETTVDRYDEITGEKYEKKITKDEYVKIFTGTDIEIDQKILEELLEDRQYGVEYDNEDGFIGITLSYCDEYDEKIIHSIQTIEDNYDKTVDLIHRYFPEHFSELKSRVQLYHFMLWR